MIEIILGAFINRARGSHFYGYVDSTQASRVLAAFLFAALTAPYVSPIPLMVCACAFWVYMVPGWDFTVFQKHMEPPSIGFKPADYIMRKVSFPYGNSLLRNIWGGLAMSMRQSLIMIPMGVASAVYADTSYLINGLAFPFMGFAYPVGFWISRRIRKESLNVAISEWLAGGVIGGMK